MAEQEHPSNIPGVHHHEVTPSDVDALGRDKRRAVVGKTYGPTWRKQATLYGGFLAVLAAAVVGFLLLANSLDQPPEQVKVEAPWAQGEAIQIPTPGVDQVPP